MADPDLTFVIFGAAAEVIKPIYSRYTDAEFICLVNSSTPEYLPGTIISSADEGYLQGIEAALKQVSRESKLILVNGAVFQDDNLFVAHTEEAVERMLSVGVLLPVSICQVVLREMLSRRSGRLINISSFRANAPAKGTVIYSAIKSFGESFFSGLGIEYGRMDITSNSIALGFADTRLLDKLPVEKVSQFKKSVCKRKFVPAEEFLRAIDFLIKSEYLNGTVIDLDGGLEYLR